MVVGVGESATTMRKNVFLRNMLSYNFNGPTNIGQLSTEALKCEQWTPAQVAEWIRGIDEMSAYCENFTQHNIDGSRLLNVDEYTLRKIGVTRGSARTRILNAVDLLLYYTDTVKRDNLQRAAMKITVSTKNMLNAISIATAVINNPLQSARVFDVLSAVLCAVTDVYTNVRRLMCWLDRSPFDDKPEFITLREKISAFIKEVIDCVNNPNNPKFFSVPQLLVERGKRVQDVCTKIMHMNDPSVLYTTTLERVTIRKNVSCRWGFDVGRMFTGIGMVTRVNMEMPTGISGKIEAGDEILEVNGEPVVGWTMENVMRAVNVDASSAGPQELVLLLNKRPRELWSSLPVHLGGGHATPVTPLTPSRPTTLLEGVNERMNMMLDFKMKIQPDLIARNQNNRPLSLRSRSYSFNLSMSSPPPKARESCVVSASRCASLFVSNNNRRQVSRRASVWSESPTAMLRSPLDGLRYQMESNAWLLLLASWGNGRQKPGGGGFFGRSGGPLTPRIGEGAMMKKEESDYSSSDETKKPPHSSEIEYTNVETINDHEVDRLKAHFRLHLPSIHDNDWNQPIREITGLRMTVKRIHLESGSNVPVIDSPLSTIQAKITRFFYGDPSPSHSVASTGGGGGTHSATASVALPETISTSISSEKLVVDGATTRTPLAGRIEQYLFGGGGSSSSSVNSPLPSTPGVEKFTMPRRTPAVGASSGGGSAPRTPSDNMPGSSSHGCLFQMHLPTSTGSPLATGATLDVTISFSGGDDLPIKTVARNAKGSKLAPLAEPDEVGELSSAKVATTAVESKVAMEMAYLQNLAVIPCKRHDHKTYEGAVRRQKLLLLDGRTKFLTRNERGSQWIKCWMVLEDDILYVYQNENAQEADVVINVPCFYLTTSTDLKTTKHHVFALCWNLETVNFALYSNDELKHWLKHLQPIAHKSSGSTLLSTTPVGGYSMDFDYGDEERVGAIFVRGTPPVSADDYGGTASGSTGPPTPSPLFAKTMTIPPPLSPISLASSSSGGALAFTTPLPSPRSNNFSFLPTKIFSKDRSHSSLRSQNVINARAAANANSTTTSSIVSLFSSTTIAPSVDAVTPTAGAFFPASDALLSTSNTSSDTTVKGSPLNVPVSISISSSSPPPLPPSSLTYSVAETPKVTAEVLSADKAVNVGKPNTSNA